MKSYHDMHYKEVTPDITINTLIKKLYDMGLKVSEKWFSDEVVGTASLRVTFKETEIGCNGKGADKTFARASAYAELFERYQNDMLCDHSMEIRDEALNKYGFELAPDEKYLSVQEICSQENAFMSHVFRLLNIDKDDLDAKRQGILDAFNPDKAETKEFLCLPFFSVKDNQVYYLPKNLYTKYYGSNGMAAGNTPEEAIVQGLSEIFERIAQKRLLREKPSLPDIPVERIQQYPYIYDWYQRTTQIPGYSILLKDCSFGGKYPVAALLILQKDTGRYGIKLGCHPDMMIAIERTFTEATQGHELTAYTNRSLFDFLNQAVDNKWNIENSFLHGQAQYGYELFSDTPNYEYCDMSPLGQLSNEALLKQWIEQIQSEGYDILIRDVSYLGFPSYHIVIPDLSEIVDWNQMEHRASNTFRYVGNLMMHPENIQHHNCQHIISALDYFSRSQFENRVCKYYKVSVKNKIPYEGINCDGMYLSAMCNVLRGEYAKAFNKVRAIEAVANKRGLGQEQLVRLKAVSTYLSGMATLQDHNKVMKYIEILFSFEVCKEIDEVFMEPTKVIVKQYPTGAELHKLKESNTSEVRKSITHKLREIQKLNPIHQGDLGKVFQYMG